MSFKAITCGAVVVIGDYFVCMLLVRALISTSAPRAAWIALGIFALLLCGAAGFTGACLATERRILNGTLAGVVGGAVLLLALACLAPLEAAPAFLGPLLTVTVLAAVGALVATKLWPRRDAQMSA